MSAESDPTDWRNLWQTDAKFWERNEAPPRTKRLLASGRVPPGQGRGLIPGCGSGHDAFALSQAPGMKEIIGMDIVPEAVHRAEELLREFKSEHPEASLRFAIGDFFALPSVEQFDVILDHTFLCALPPSRRAEWASKMAELLRPGGVLVTYMFPLADHEGGPPFALSEQTYTELLRGHFLLVYIETIPERFHTWKATTGEKLAMWKRKSID